MSPSVVDTEARAISTLRGVLRRPDATWNGEGQRRAVLAVLAAEHDVIAVLATGAGKTMLIVLPALMDLDHTTIVVLPLKALLNDLSRRMTEFGVGHQVWTTSGNQACAIRSDTNLVLVGVDQAVKSAFKTAIARHHCVLPVARIIADEAQAWLTAASFRPCFGNFGEFRKIAPAQLVLLSATIMPAAVPKLYAAFNLDPHTLVVRTTTIRPEIRYIVERPQGSLGLVVPRVKVLVEGYTRAFRSEERGLIYAETRAITEQISEKLGIPCYQGGKEFTDERRRASVETWTSGSSKFMVCTSAFLAGIDMAHVRVVVFAGCPLRVDDFIQGGGRGGRDGLEAIVHVVPQPLDSWEHRITNDVADITGEALMRGIMFQPPTGRQGCVRYLLSRFIDGVATACTDVPSAAECSRCSPITQSGPLPLSRTSRKYNNALVDNSLSDKRCADADPHDGPALTTWKKQRHIGISGALPGRFAGGPTTRTTSLESDVGPTDFAALSNASARQYSGRLLANYEIASELRQVLGQWEGTCACCFDHDGSVVRGHQWYYCKEHNDSAQIADLKELRSHIHFTTFDSSTADAPNICWRCAVPQFHDLHPDFIAGRCQYDDNIYPTVYYVWQHEDRRKAASQHFNRDWRNRAQYGVWLAERDAVTKIPNIVAVYLWRMAKV